MGKGKNKAFKLKQYKVPPEKYVVVINPWGLPDQLDNMCTKLNEVGAWFELLLKKDYPNARVREIFYQKTHRNIIVELPREIDITRYLGAYHYSRFHNHISPDDNRFAYIYEYQYATFGNPGNKNWTGIVPTNPSIPAGLLQVLKDPFPLPSPAPPPPSDTPYAKPVPHELNALSLRNAIMASTSDSLNGKGKSMESLFTPYEPPSHYVAISGSHVDEVAHEVKKMDPYEEEEREKALLRSELLPIKKVELNEAAVGFLDSIPNVKREEKPVLLSSTSTRDSTYTELLNLFNTSPNELRTGEARDDVVVKSEVFDTVLPYCGSDSTLTLRSTCDDSEEREKALLQSKLFRPIKKVESNEAVDFLNSIPNVKREEKPVVLSSTSPRDSGYDGDGNYKPSTELLNLFNTLPNELRTGEARDDVVVKSEVLDTALRYNSLSDRKNIVVKSEVVETKLSHDIGYSQSSSSSSRDPRRRHTASVKHERNWEGQIAEEAGSVKRLKMDH